MLLFGAKPGVAGATDYFLAEPSTALVGDAKERILTELRQRRARSEAEPIRLVPYDPGATPSGDGSELQFFKVSEEPQVAGLLSAFPTSFDTVPPFRQEGAEADPPASFVVVSRLTTGEPVRFFRRQRNVVELRARNVVWAQLAGAQLKELRGVPLAIDFSFGCVQVGEYMFVFAPKSFEYLFGYDQYLKNEAASIIPTLTGLISEDSFDAFSQRALASSFAVKRMRQIRRVLQAGATVSKFARMIRRHGLQHVRVEGVGAAQRLVFDPGHIRELIKLLCEDYLPGPASGLPYDSSSKRVHPVR